ncbi:MAG: hypothetical protein ACE15F_04115 [bacterium]
MKEKMSQTVERIRPVLEEEVSPYVRDRLLVELPKGEELLKVGGEGQSGAAGHNLGSVTDISHSESSTGNNLPGTEISSQSVGVEGQPPVGGDESDLEGDRGDELVPMATGTDVEPAGPSVGQHNYDLRSRSNVILSRSRRIDINEQVREINKILKY